MSERSTSFRTKLVAYALLVVSIVAIPMLYIEVQRPWKEMYSLIGKTEVLLDTLVSTIDPQELRLINEFALEIISELHEGEGEDGGDEEGLQENHYSNWVKSHAFDLLVSEGALPSEEAVAESLKENDVQLADFSYADLDKWYRFWEEKFRDRPDHLAAFRKYHKILRQVSERAAASGFQVANVYFTLDRGKSDSGYFKENLALVLESLPWWEGSSPGEPYNLVESSTEYWRAAYDAKTGGTLGFGHNPVSDPEDWYLPRFDTDEYGVWFTGWFAMEQKDDKGEVFYSVVSVDFDAAVVKKMMLETAVAIAVSAAVLILVIFFIASVVSRNLTRPIDALTKGAEAVMSGDYNHRVTAESRDEFRKLIEVFNRMIVWVREMINLKETLSKILSEELAEKAAKEGLVLGGQQAECTIMFTDFAGFSTLTRKISARETVDTLNHYFGELIAIIKKWGGFPDKFIGDAIVAIFGAPVKFGEHADNAVRCAVELQRKMREINERRVGEGKIVFEMRIGLNTGPVIVGAVGCDLKLEYTSIGETTNLANRMEAKCKLGHVLMAENTYNQLSQSIIEEFRIDKTPEKELIKGYAEPISAYGIYVHGLMITQENEADDPLRYYRYQTVERDRK